MHHEICSTLKATEAITYHLAPLSVRMLDQNKTFHLRGGQSPLNKIEKKLLLCSSLRLLLTDRYVLRKLNILCIYRMSSA